MKEVFKGAGLCLAVAIMVSAPVFASEEGSVKIVLQSPLTSVDACQIQTGSTSRVMKLNVYEALTEIDVHKGGVVPRLATGWEQISPQTWRFHLRKGVQFHDGAPFTATSVQQSLQRVLNPALSCDAYQKYFSNTQVSTKVLDEHTIDITTTPAQPILPVFLESVAITSPATPQNQLTREPQGTGPYRLSKWDTQREIILERNPNYWGERPAVDKAVYVWREDSFVRATMVKLGEADLGMSIADQHADNPKTDISFANNDITRIHIHVDQAPLNDIRVRKALNLALDRQSLIGVLLNAMAKPASQCVGPAVLGYNFKLKPYPYDPTTAKKLVDEARRDGVDVGREIVLNAAANDFPNADEVREAMVAMWAQVGLNVRVNVLELSLFRAALRPPFDPKRQPTMSMTSHDNLTGDAGFSILSKYHSSSWQADIPSPSMDQKIEKAMLATGDQRREQFAEIFAEVANVVVPEVWLYEMASTVRVAPRIHYVPTSNSNVVLKLSDITIN